jgi:ubiquinone/menaquinone biosynthesis C-methylase UbiE
MNDHRRSLFHVAALTWLFTAAIALVLTGATEVLAGDDEYADLKKLDKEYLKAYEDEDFAKALEIAEQMLDITFPKHVDALYRITAMHCRLGKLEEAYEWFRMTLDAGFWDYSKLFNDEDFAAIRDDDRFKELVQETRITRYLEMLERPGRDEFQKPDEVMKTLAFEPGDKVADIGAGSGYFTIPIAKAVGPEGIVWAIDIRQEMLDYIEDRLQADKLGNVRLMLVDPDDPQLPKGKVDTILLVDTWHYIRDPEYAKKLREGLAPGGRVVVIDYIPKPWEERPWGPPEQQHTPIEEIDGHFAEAGLKQIESYDFLPEQYFLVYGAE